MPEHLTAVATGAPENQGTTESEEMYLITVARAMEAGSSGLVGMGKIAEALEVTTASANEMVRKLEARGLLHYEPYRGASLTEAGTRVASRVLRARRLWTTFLAEHLGFAPLEADEQACHLEHATDAIAVDRLAGFLGNPDHDALGRPIPASSEPVHPNADTNLAALSVGMSAEIVEVDASHAERTFLEGEGISVGTRISVLGTGQGQVLVEAKNPVAIATRLAKVIRVRVTDTK